MAAQHFSAVIEMAPKFASGWYARPRSKQALGYFGPAIEDLQAALRLDAMHYPSLVLLGEIFEYFERPDLAFLQLIQRFYYTSVFRRRKKRQRSRCIGDRRETL